MLFFYILRLLFIYVTLNLFQGLDFKLNITSSSTYMFPIYWGLERQFPQHHSRPDRESIFFSLDPPVKLEDDETY